MKEYGSSEMAYLSALNNLQDKILFMLEYGVRNPRIR